MLFLDRSTRAEIAAHALMVNAKNEEAVAFYRHHGFIALPDSPMPLFLPQACASAIQKTGNKAR